MTTIKIGDKTLVIEDGCNVEVSGDDIRVKPGALSATQQPFQPYYANLAPGYVGTPGTPIVTSTYKVDANGDSPYVIMGNRC
jgi:hypothetical protein